MMHKPTDTYDLREEADQLARLVDVFAADAYAYRAALNVCCRVEPYIPQFIGAVSDLRDTLIEAALDQFMDEISEQTAKQICGFIEGRNEAYFEFQRFHDRFVRFAVICVAAYMGSYVQQLMRDNLRRYIVRSCPVGVRGDTEVIEAIGLSVARHAALRCKRSVLAYVYAKCFNTEVEIERSN